MSIVIELKPNNILKKAKSMVGQAQFEILATMDLAEELQNPLPDDYFSLLQRKILSGVSLTRLAFGAKNDLEIFEKSNPINNNYSCILVDKEDYKRMLMIDHKYLMFSRYIDNKRKFFYTEDAKIIKKYRYYFMEKLKVRGIK